MQAELTGEWRIANCVRKKLLRVHVEWTQNLPQIEGYLYAINFAKNSNITQ